MSDSISINDLINSAFERAQKDFQREVSQSRRAEKLASVQPSPRARLADRTEKLASLFERLAEEGPKARILLKEAMEGASTPQHLRQAGTDQGALPTDLDKSVEETQVKKTRASSPDTVQKGTPLVPATNEGETSVQETNHATALQKAGQGYGGGGYGGGGYGGGGYGGGGYGEEGEGEEGEDPAAASLSAEGSGLSEEDLAQLAAMMQGGQVPPALMAQMGGGMGGGMGEEGDEDQMPPELYQQNQMMESYASVTNPEELQKKLAGDPLFRAITETLKLAHLNQLTFESRDRVVKEAEVTPLIAGLAYHMVKNALDSSGEDSPRVSDAEGESDLEVDVPFVDSVESAIAFKKRQAEIVAKDPALRHLFEHFPDSDQTDLSSAVTRKG
jgi:hypothetical protein